MTYMDLTLGLLASFVVHEKFCLMINKKVFTCVISIFGLMFLGQPQEQQVLFTFEGGKRCHS